ncbi:hypothetical protein ACEWY4_017426 [Coilia grayii]|uniref:Reverse transcriptase domain-containing protein n=1 Tax=Coilia grayii TaxID=363190 RepID=A0ABD1JH33_9TELE
MSDFYQYVTCPTRRGKILDLCYGTVRDAYKSIQLPPLGSVDHNCIQLIPKYRSALRREQVQIKEVKEWTEESVMCLQECYDCTVWDTFKESCNDLDELTDVVCSYVAFCRDMIIPCKQIKIYPNNKPWANGSIKNCIRKKRQAHKHGNATDFHAATKELKTEIFKAKQRYKSKLEQKMAENNLGSAWSSMKTIAGIKNQSSSSHISLEGFKSENELANALNCFYNRFDTFDFSQEVDELQYKLKNDQHTYITYREVENVFYRTKNNKSHGPDNSPVDRCRFSCESICGRVIKLCTRELSPIFHFIFNKSLQTQYVPKVWKHAVVVPVPKSGRPKTLNDFRPIALTSIVMKHFERLVRSQILSHTEHALDPMQFAYRPNRGVEDATLTLLHVLLKHLEGSGSHAQILFIDFSSALNTIQPNILVNRLLAQLT